MIARWQGRKLNHNVIQYMNVSKALCKAFLREESMEMSGQIHCLQSFLSVSLTFSESVPGHLQLYR